MYQEAARQLLQEIKKEAQALSGKLRLGIVQVGKPNQATQRFLAQKQRTGQELGVEVRVFEYSDQLSTTQLRKRLASLVHSGKNTGLILQLPLPAKFNTQYLLNALPPHQDVDVLSTKSLSQFLGGTLPIEPPVVGAVKTVLALHNLDYKTKRILLLGAGRLVGRPLALWLLREDVGFCLATKTTPNVGKLLKQADLVVSAVGQEGFVKKGQLKKGAILLDFDKTKGGLGPLVVAHLFKNLVTLARL